jgi:dTMP kinase
VDRGKLITIEGLDGAGKTTLVTALAAKVAARGVTVSQLREPGGVAVSERIRELLREPALAGDLDPRAEALLYAAARAQLTASKLMPQLKAGTWVLLDRFVDSSLAYQGGGRQLGVEAIRALNLFATGGLTPDRTLLLRLEPRAGRVRQQARATEPDRIEQEDNAFFETVAATYDELASADPQRIRQLDASAGPDEVLRQALHAIEDLLPADRHT